ncbi:NADH-ubiquinone oxidoreductase 78 kDa subunit, mitochondrial, partial [Zancudomyces culisetae]
LLGADEFDPSSLPKSAFVVYQGHHGDNGAHYADVILPSAAYTEKTATYVNTEGRAQLTRAVLSPPGAAREDWKIIRALSEFADFTLPYSDISQLRSRMADVSPTLVEYDSLTPSSTDLAALSLRSLAAPSSASSTSNLSGAFTNLINNFYMTDPISRASKTMAKATAAFSKSH